MAKSPLALALAATLATISPATAQPYPSRPITIVVPFPAGGVFDSVIRIVADRMKATLAQPIIIENVGGAGGTIGVGRVARASPDGYTLCLGYWGTHVINPAVYALSYDPLKDFEPIALLASNPAVIVANRALPAANLRELTTWLETIRTRRRWRRSDPAARRTSQDCSCRKSPTRTSSSCRIAAAVWRCRLCSPGKST